MKLILASMIVAIAVGYAAGGRLSTLSKVSLRWAPFALVGLALQLVSAPGRWPLVLLGTSFVLLLAFGIVNRRLRGFPLIILGIALNSLVIGVNRGMPVERDAVIASGQQATLTDLVRSGGAKRHLATPDDRLLFLADVIAIPPPVAQVVSVGDIATYAGVGWLIIVGMVGPFAWRRRRSASEHPSEDTDRYADHAHRRRRDGERSDDASEPTTGRRNHERGSAVRLLEASIVLPLFGWFAFEVSRDPNQFRDWRILVWAAAIAAIDLLPIAASDQMAFSLSFPVELSAALLYAPPVAAAVAFLGALDERELRREIPPMKALYTRGQIALSVAAESLVFHQIVTLQSRWYLLGPSVILAALAGYAVNVLVVASYAHLQRGDSVVMIIREMHVGVFGEFVLSYLGLALFAVLVAVSTQTIGLWALIVFVAPLAFARQMFQRTQSLQVATTELAARQAENEYQALHDSLTGLPNRVLFHLRLMEAIDAAARSGTSIAVMLMDLDHFKEINDALGHHFGDLLLKVIGPRLGSVLREGDLMARLGGDEFGVLLTDLPSTETPNHIARRLLQELEEPVAVEGLALVISGSIGIAMYPAHGQDADSVLQRADVAMYASKEDGGGYEIYHEDFDRHSPMHLTLMGSVRPALENNEFVLFYQPKARFSDGAVEGAEALIRWEHRELGLVQPDDFIPFVEKTGLLRPLTQFVVNEALQHCRELADRGTPLEIAVNVSPRSLLDVQLPSQIAAALETWGVAPEHLKLEITESFLMADSGRSAAVMQRLAGLGVVLSIDDFGTGYSSLSHLKRLPIHEIKVDRSFVTNMLVDPNDAMIVRATIELGKNLGMRVVAEGVENRETYELLRSFGCDEAQGYFLSEPLPPDRFDRWLAARTNVAWPVIDHAVLSRELTGQSVHPPVSGFSTLREQPFQQKL